VSRATLPRPQAPIAGNLMPTNEWYQYLSDIAITADNAPELQSQINALDNRVRSLESEESGLGSIRGNGSVDVTGQLGGLVQIELQGDVAELPAWHYYGTDSTGEARTFHEFPVNLQSVSALAGEGYTFRLSDGTWGQRTILPGVGVTITDDLTSLTIGLVPSSAFDFDEGDASTVYVFGDFDFDEGGA